MIQAIQKKYPQKPYCVSDGLWRMKTALVVKDNILRSKSDRLFLSNSLRHKALTLGHGGHFGRTHTIER